MILRGFLPILQLKKCLGILSNVPLPFCGWHSYLRHVWHPPIPSGVEVWACGFLSLPGWGFLEGGGRALWPCTSHSLEHNDRKHKTRVSVLDLIFMSCGHYIFCEWIFHLPRGPIPNLTAAKLEMVAGFCTRFIDRLHLSKEAVG